MILCKRLFLTAVLIFSLATLTGCGYDIAVGDLSNEEPWDPLGGDDSGPAQPGDTDPDNGDIDSDDGNQQDPGGGDVDPDDGAPDDPDQGADPDADSDPDGGPDDPSDGEPDTPPEPSDDAMPDFSVLDANVDSARFADVVSPRDYLGQVSAWYFGHST